jgi:transcriptional regulator with XRE-family HTH domain
MLAKRIQEAREQKSMSKAELARRVNVSRASVSMWEDGKNISISNIIKIAEVLDVTPEWLQYGVENESVKIEDLADCLEYTREISSRYDWELSDRQYARVAAYLYKERSRGMPINDQIASFLRQAS